MPRLLRLAAALAILGAGWLLAGPGRRTAGVLAAAALLAVVFLLLILVARLAHSAFEEGRHGQAAVLYKILRFTTVDPGTRAAIDVSLAGCRLARDDFAGALAELERIDPAPLAPSARAAWLNNRAYARGRGAIDPAAGLTEVDDAMKLRPDIAGYRHTRGIVLLALGRLDDAIADLDSVWPHIASDKAPQPLLEAERCYDLGICWSRKGELEYARDYFRRARGVAPRSTWADRAAQWLTEHPS